MASSLISVKREDVTADGRTNGRTDRPANGPTDEGSGYDCDITVGT